MNGWRLVRLSRYIYLCSAGQRYSIRSQPWRPKGALTWVRPHSNEWYLIVAEGEARGWHCFDAAPYYFRPLTALEELALLVNETTVPTVQELVGAGSKDYLQ